MFLCIEGSRRLSIPRIQQNRALNIEKNSCQKLPRSAFFNGTSKSLHVHPTLRFHFETRQRP